MPILLNYRRSPVLIAGRIALPPAERKKDERRGDIIKPSRTELTDRQAARVKDSDSAKRLFEAEILEWEDKPARDAEQSKPAVLAGGGAPPPERDTEAKAKAEAETKAKQGDDNKPPAPKR